MKKDIKIGSTLKALCVKKKLTQAQLANVLFLTPQAISKWECNKSFPDIPTQVLLSELYGVPTDEILGSCKTSFLMSIFSKKRKEVSICLINFFA